VSAIDGSFTTNNVEIYPKNLNIDYEEVSTADIPDPIAMEGAAFVADPSEAVSIF